MPVGPLSKQGWEGAARNTKLRGRLSTVDLLIKVAFSAKKAT
jgi:hypothetical protein